MTITCVPEPAAGHVVLEVGLAARCRATKHGDPSSRWRFDGSRWRAEPFLRNAQSPPALVSGGKPRTGRRLARRVWRARSEVGNSELSGMAGPGHPGQVQGDRPPWQLVRCQSAPSTTVPVDDSTPPVPLHSAVRAFGTWRSPHSPRSWRVASTKVNIPYIPGWV